MMFNTSNMAEITTHRRNLAAFLDPTLHIYSMNQPKSSSATGHHRAGPPPDPTIPTIIHTVSEHKSLSATHHPHLQPPSTVIHSSCTALAKSKSQRRGSNFPKKAALRQQQQQQQKQKGSDEIKKACKKKENCEELKRERLLSVGRRRSFCSSQIELGDLFFHNNVKVVSVDMHPFMQIHAVNSARNAYDTFEKFTPKDLALTLKKVNPSPLMC